MTNTTNRLDALNALRAMADDDADLAEMITDYCDGADFLDTDTAALLATITGDDDPDMAEITKALELIEEIDPIFASYLAGAAELCITHACDPENCRDEH